MTDVQVEREKISLFHSRAKEAGNRLSTAILTISLGGTAVYFATLTGGTNSSFSIFEKIIVSVGLIMFALTSALCLFELKFDANRFYIAASNLESVEANWEKYNRLKKLRLGLIYCSYVTLCIALLVTTVFVLLRINNTLHMGGNSFDASFPTVKATLGSSNENANEILKLLYGALTPIIAILAAYIAWRQHQISRSKLKLDLYDRRFKVYRGLMDLFAAVLRDVKVSRADLANYYSQTNEKVFLFDSDIVAFMIQVREKAVELRQIKEKMEHITEDGGNELNELSERDTELLRWFDEQLNIAPRRFEKYLGFKENL